MSVYTIELTDLDEGAVLADLSHSSFQYVRALEADGSCTIRSPLRPDTMTGWGTDVTDANLSPGERHIYVKRDGSLRWAGNLYAYDADSAADDLIIHGVGWYDLLRTRYRSDDQTFSGDLLDWAWSQISYTNAIEDTGITRFSDSETPRNINRTILGEDFTPITTILEQVASIPHLWFSYEITPEREWRAFREYTNQTDPAFVQDVNLSRVNYTKDGRMPWQATSDGMVNELTVTGSGRRGDRLHYTATNSGAVAQYKLRQGTFGGEFSSQSAVRAQALRRIGNPHMTDPLTLINIETIGIDPGDIVLGDSYLLSYDDGFFFFDEEPVRPVAITVDVSAENEELVSVVCRPQVFDMDIEESS